MTTRTVAHKWRGFVDPVNTTWHQFALIAFTVIVLAHWAEHIAQAVQVYALGWPVPEARGALGLAFPKLVTSEWLHYGYALGMLVGLATLRYGFVGRSRTWWMVALWIQFWHHLEHLLLLLQAFTGTNMLGFDEPTSVVQVIIPRVELHLFYNTIVFVPMVLAMLSHQRPLPGERDLMQCSCVSRPLTTNLTLR